MDYKFDPINYVDSEIQNTVAYSKGIMVGFKLYSTLRFQDSICNKYHIKSNK